MTTYLADIKQQYADHEGGLGMVDVVLGSLMRGSGTAQPRSVRSAIPEPGVLDAGERLLPRRRPATTTEHVPVSVSISIHVGIGPVWRPR